MSVEALRFKTKKVSLLQLFLREIPGHRTFDRDSAIDLDKNYIFCLLRSTVVAGGHFSVAVLRKRFLTGCDLLDFQRIYK